MGTIGTRHQRISTLLQYLRHKIMAVVFLTRQRHKYVAGGGDAAVGGDFAHSGVDCDGRQAEGLGDKV